MKRYKILIADMVKTDGLRSSAKTLGTTAQSLSDWIETSAEPRLANLEKIARHFRIPVPALLLEQGDDSELNDWIITALYKLDPEQKLALAETIKSLMPPASSRKIRRMSD